MAEQELANLAALLADRTRAQICLSLMDGRAWTSSELSAVTGTAASTTSEHLSRLIAGGLLIEHRQGRHRYVALAGSKQAHLLEVLLAYLGPVPSQHSLTAVRASTALARGRTCYDHLAGRLGVAIAAGMTERGLLGSELTVTPEGMQWLIAELGVPQEQLQPRTRPTSRACLDWTERRPHLGGAAGAQLSSHLQERNWVCRIGTGRAVRLTPAGATALGDLLGLDAGLITSG